MRDPFTARSGRWQGKERIHGGEAWLFHHGSLSLLAAARLDPAQT
jgi:hypothetical protein